MKLRRNHFAPKNRPENYGVGVLVPLEDFDMLAALLTDAQKSALKDFRHRKVRMEDCPVLDE